MDSWVKVHAIPIFVNVPLFLFRDEMEKKTGKFFGQKLGKIKQFTKFCKKEKFCFLFKKFIHFTEVHCNIFYYINLKKNLIFYFLFFFSFFSSTKFHFRRFFVEFFIFSMNSTLKIFGKFFSMKSDHYWKYFSTFCQ
jgi:hypothetical protein